MIEMLRNSTSHIFVEELDDVLSISGDDFHHLTHVLRVNVGDSISAASRGNVRGYKVKEISTTQLQLVFDTEISFIEEPQIEVAVSLFKMDRLEWGISKAIETGATSITIGPSNRSSISIDKKKKEKVLVRLCALAKSASSQSRRSLLVEIKFTDSLLDFVENLSIPVVLCEPDGDRNRVDAPLCLVVGPEGGFDENELARFDGFAKRICLSPHILRAETALGLAPALVNF